MKKYRCMPIAIGIPIVMLLVIPFWIIMMILEQKWDFHIVALFNIVLDIVIAILTAIPAARRVEIYQDKIVCKGLFPAQSYELYYEKCNIGMDYSWQNGSKLWWIYICYGNPPRFKTYSPNRMNAVKFRPGYIKMHYNDDIYNALLSVLPKKQYEGLVSAKKWMK